MNGSLRLLAAAAAAALVAASCSGGDAVSTRSSEPGPPQASRPTSPIGNPVEFVPATNRENGKVVLPLEFPDGTTAELVYPPLLRLAQMGLRPFAAGGFGTPSLGARDLAIFFEGVPKVIRSGGAPRATYDTHSGASAAYWDTAESWDPEGTLRHLILRFGSWYVAVWDRGDNDRDMQKWARSLRGTETDEGFLVLRAKRPLRLTRHGQHNGPGLMFEGGDPERRIRVRPMLLLFPNRCDDYMQPSSELDDVQIVNGIGVSRSHGFAAWCFEEDDMVVHAYGPERFIERATRHLDIRDVELGS
jgi:hypothetical protein